MTGFCSVLDVVLYTPDFLLEGQMPVSWLLSQCYVLRGTAALVSVFTISLHRQMMLMLSLDRSREPRTPALSMVRHTTNLTVRYLDVPVSPMFILVINN